MYGMPNVMPKVKPVVIIGAKTENILIHRSPGIDRFGLQFTYPSGIGEYILIFYIRICQVKQVGPPGQVQIESIITVSVIFDLLERDSPFA